MRKFDNNLSFQDFSEHHSDGTPDTLSCKSSNLNMNQGENANNETSYVSTMSSTSNGKVKTFDHEYFSNVINLSSVNSESHKKYELDNINFFKNLLEDKISPYDNDDRLINQLPKTLIVNNHDNQFMYPWVNLIMPNYSKPYCSSLKVKSDKNSKDETKSLKYSFRKHDNFNHSLFYLTESQMFNIIDSIMEQIIETPKDVPVLIDWRKVSDECGLSQEVCKDFWWSFDRTHIKDPFGGCIFSVDWNHYYKVDESYFIELKNRVRNLVSLAKDSRDERERISTLFEDIN